MRQERASVQAALSGVAAMTSGELLARRKVPFQPAPSYDVQTVAGMSLIQRSDLALDSAELATLAAQGFAVSRTREMPSFLYGYARIYSADLPVYVSADSILYSIHDSYEEMLKALERELLVGELDALLSGMRERLAGVEASAARSDADVYLTVAHGLLRGQPVTPSAGGDASLVSSLYGKASAGAGWQKVRLFGVARDEDFSQFVPRGHYADDPLLERYFRASMWLGRIDFRLLETQPDGTREFRRRQLEAAVLLRELIDARLQPHFDRIDAVVTAFVGEHDYMQLSEVTALLSDLGTSSLHDLAAVEDARIVRAIDAGGYGMQRISSHIMFHGLDSPGTLPLSSSFALLGQRYVIDSHVFSNVVFDRVANGSVFRMMPSPLDVAFAALENDQAVTLLKPELERYDYASELASMRVLADAHPPEFWKGNLYNLWLSAIRTLSPDAGTLTAQDSGLFPAARSEAWGRRLLGAQLASWAELRHDTILYAKQSYTGAISCEFPDAYVDPYPEFYAKVGEYAAEGKALVARLEFGGPESTNELKQLRVAMETYFDEVGNVAARLREMAEYQRTGAQFTAEMMEFINQAVTVQVVCGGAFLSNVGWYGKLFFNPHGALEFDPTIADVHTQPTDENGTPVGRVLHVGTGSPRIMVVVAEGCTGPRAYVGLASSYYETITDNFERLTDAQWKNGVLRTTQEPSWAP